MSLCKCLETDINYDSVGKIAEVLLVHERSMYLKQPFRPSKRNLTTTDGMFREGTKRNTDLKQESNAGPPAPEAGIIPLDH